MKRERRTSAGRRPALTLVLALLTLVLAACGGGSADGLTVDGEGNYSFGKVKDAAYYVVEFYDVKNLTADGVIPEEASPVLKQTLQAGAGTSGTLEKVRSLSFGTYIPTVYAIMADKSTSQIVQGDELIIGGTLTAPEIVVQRDYGSAKVSVTDRCFDEVYFATEAVYSFTAEVYTDQACSGEAVATETFGAEAAYIDPTNSSNPVWLRGRSVSILLEEGTYYIRCKANGSSQAQVSDSAYSAVCPVTVSAGETDVKYCTGVYEPSTGVLTMTGENMLEFGNGAAMFTEFNLVNDADTVRDGDLYTFNGAANCDMHLMGEPGAVSGEAYTCGPRLMPIDKPDIRGTWETNDDGSITVTLMADYQYYTDETDRKST